MTTSLYVIQKLHITVLVNTSRIKRNYVLTASHQSFIQKALLLTESGIFMHKQQAHFYFHTKHTTYAGRSKEEGGDEVD